MAASTTIVRGSDNPHKFSWDLINQANPSHRVIPVASAEHSTGGSISGV